MVLKRSKTGSNLVEYVIPTAILAVSVGLGLYYISSNGSLLNNILGSTSGSKNMSGAKFTFGTAGLVDGIYKDASGNVNLCNKSGNCVYIPETYYNKYEDELISKLESGNFDTNSSNAIGTETSGAVGVEDVAYLDNSGLNIYSSLLDTAANNNTDKNAQELLDKLSNYGQRIDTIENNMLDIKEKVDGLTKTYEDDLAEYLKAKKIFDNQMAQLQGTTINKSNLSSITAPLEALNEKYTKYNDSKANLEAQVDSELAIVNTEFTDLKENTGVAFDQTIQKVEESELIEEETKEMVLPISKKMSAVKDSVEIIEQEIQALTAVFDFDANSYKDFDSVLWSFDISIDYNAGDEHVKKGKGW